MSEDFKPAPLIFDSDVELPIVSLSADRTILIESGDPQLLTFNLSEPAPVGGLVVKLRIDDPDGDSGPGDTSFPPELISNIVGFGQVEEDGLITASLTIAEGATTATFGIAAFEDDLVEIGETYSLTLLEDENYRADSASTTITTTIEDAITLPIVSLTPETVTASEGETFTWNFSLNRPAPEGGLSLFLPIIFNNDPAPGDVEYFVDGSSNISDFEFVTISDESISQIYAFGDSYSDDGRSFELSTDAVNAGVPDSFILPADPALGLYDPQGRWTNGPTAVEVLAQELQVDLTDYAVGGAKSGNGNYYSWLDPVEDTGVFGQIEQFSTELSGQPADPDALYFLFASANDLFEYTDFGLPGTVEELAAQTVENTIEGVSDLAELGAQQFLVVNSSDLDILPGVIEFGQVEEATLFTDEVNELLPQALETLSQELGVEIALYDHVEISDEIRSNPQDFGLTNVDDPYQPVFPVEPPAGSQPDEYYFWDEYHPTRRVHQIIGEDMADFVDTQLEEDGVSIGFNITIAEGATEATLVSEVIADNLTEGEENFTTVIADGIDYRANPAQNQVVTNLLDVVVPDGDETLEGTFGPDVLVTGSGNDLIKGKRGDDVLDGGAGHDRLIGQAGDDTIVGGTGDDKLWGEAGDDLLDGGDGDDFLRGWAGDDTLVGGADADTFVVEALPGTDTIADFASGEDTIELKGGLTFADLSVASDGTNTTIALAGDILAILEGVDTVLTSADFVTV
ncbi:MAG: SGNH/GDSL hydrolase family protein [Cyanobacteriota bacterium]|nr:SGNH/GDSL hydrolase family protein [Cyanobacteriota bacterium]